MQDSKIITALVINQHLLAVLPFQDHGQTL